MLYYSNKLKNKQKQQHKNKKIQKKQNNLNK